MRKFAASPRRLRAAALGLGLGLALMTGPAARAHALAQVPAYFQDRNVIGGLYGPVGIAFLPDGRLLTVECKTARVRLIVFGATPLTHGVTTIDSVATLDPEQGLWGLAVDPRWPAKPFIYVMYGALDSTLRVSRLTLTGALSDSMSGALSAVPLSRRDVLRDVPDRSSEHNGGCLRFGPDSMLYASFGDDVNPCHAMDPSQLYGVIARMDVRKLPDTPGPPDKAVIVPPDNPFANSSLPNERLVYARGLRNPFRFSIDKPTGRLFVGDVGLATYEEIDVVDAPGLNMGWPMFEGPQPYLPAACGLPVPPNLRAPAFYYGRTQPCGYTNTELCPAAVIGGLVIRNAGTSVSFPPEYDGQYMFSDFHNGFMWRLRDSLGTWVKAPPVAGQPNSSDWGLSFGTVTDYAQARDGSLYYCLSGVDFSTGLGEIHRIVHRAVALGVPRRSPAVSEFAAVYPSPARGSAMLRYVLARSATVQLAIFDALGRRMRRLVPPTSESASEYDVRWDGTDDTGRAVPPGVYVVRLGVDGEVMERRIPILR